MVDHLRVKYTFKKRDVFYFSNRVPKDIQLYYIRDWLRTVECPSELIDQICGWSNKSVSEGYGKGYD